MTEAAAAAQARYLEEHRARAEALAQVVSARGEFPFYRDENPEHRRLARWLSDQRTALLRRDRQNAVGWSERIQILDDIVPGWRDSRGHDGKRDDNRFEEMARYVADFRSRFGQFPAGTSTDPDAKKAASWLSLVRVSAGGIGPKSHAIDDKRRELLDQVIPGWRTARPKRNDAKFIRNARSVADHRKRTGAFPKSSSTSKEEVRLARWLARARGASRGSGSERWDNERTGHQPHLEVAWTPERDQLLDELLPGWRTNPGRHRAEHDRAFDRHVAELAAFVDQTGRFPKIGRSATAEERVLFGWHLQVRASSVGRGSLSWTPERERALDEAVPGWRETTRGLRFARRVAELAAFVDRTGHLPTNSMYVSAEERALFGWLRQARASSVGRGSLSWTPERERALDEAVPGWRETTRGLRFDRRVAELAAFVDRTGHLPTNSMYVSAEERALSGWLRQVRASSVGRGKMTWTPERERALDEAVPGWRTRERTARHTAGPRNEQFARKLEELAAFIGRTGRFPKSGRVSTPEERPLYMWLHQVRASSVGRGKMTWTPEREQDLDEAVPGWRGENRRSVESGG